MSPSPLASAATSLSSSQIITVTPEAIAELTRLRAEEPDADALGLSLQILSGRGEEFRYDLAFETVTKAAFTDEVRTHRHEDLAIKVIIPAKDLDSLQGATLDFNDRQGLVIRNPNRPLPLVVDGLVSDDELSAEVQGLITAEVNPALAAHGGFVTYVGHDSAGTAYLTMGGGCHGCSMSKQTMLDGVQTMLVEQIPAIERVRDLTDHATGENPYYH